MPACSLKGRTMNELALFAGAGGGILGGHLLGWRTVCAVEINAFCCERLMQRQNEGHLPPFPIWDDVATFDGRPWRGIVDVVSGGFPCQDISGIKRDAAGIDGPRSGLWAHMARTIREIQPRHIFLENSPALSFRGAGRVLGDLSAMGYDARWGIIGAADAGFAHLRERFWLVGHSRRPGLEGHAWHGQNAGEGAPSHRPVTPPSLRSAGWKRVVHSTDCDGEGNCPVCGSDFADCGCPGPTMDECQYAEWGGALYGRAKIRFIEPALGRVANGLANRMERISAIGNGQVPAVAKLAWEILSARP